MTASTASEYRLESLGTPSSATAWVLVPGAFLVSTLDANLFWITAGGYAAATQESILGGIEQYTDEDVRMFAEEAEWTPELAERYRDFLEG